jgi:cell division septation protein DedD
MTEDLKERKRYYFYRDQLVAIGLAFAITLVSIFILGIVTGRHVEQRTNAEYAAAEAKIPIKPPPAELDSAREAQTGEIPAVDNRSPEPASLPSADKGAARERKERESVAKVENMQTTAPAKDAAKRAPRPAAAISADEAPSSPAAREERQAPQPVKHKSLERVWTVQVKSSPDKKFADRWVERLKTKGYDAFVVGADVKGQTWYRVRVGHFAAREEAEALRTNLESKEGLKGSFLAIHQPADQASAQ